MKNVAGLKKEIIALAQEANEYNNLRVLLKNKTKGEVEKEDGISYFKQKRIEENGSTAIQALNEYKNIIDTIYELINNSLKYDKSEMQQDVIKAEAVIKDEEIIKEKDSKEVIIDVLKLGDILLNNTKQAHTFIQFAENYLSGELAATITTKSIFKDFTKITNSKIELQKWIADDVIEKLYEIDKKEAVNYLNTTITLKDKEDILLQELILRLSFIYIFDLEQDFQ